MISSIYSGTPTLPQFLLLLFSGLLLGLLCALAFRFRHPLSGGFLLTLTVLPAVACVTILLVNGSIGAGLAVAGTFSLIRFRSVPGSSRDILALFTAAAIGFALGMGCPLLACILAVTVSAAAMLFSFFGLTSHDTRSRQLRVTIPENLDHNGLFDELFQRYKMKARLTRIRSAAMGTLFELTYEVRLQEDNIPKAFLEEMRTLNCNQSILIGPVKEEETL